MATTQVYKYVSGGPQTSFGSARKGDCLSNLKAERIANGRGSTDLRASESGAAREVERNSRREYTLEFVEPAQNESETCSNLLSVEKERSEIS